MHVDELIFPDEVHGFLLHTDWLAAYQATAAFFQRTLKPNPSVAPKTGISDRQARRLYVMGAESGEQMTPYFVGATVATR